MMEPFRPTVDELAFSLDADDGHFKRKMANVLNLTAKIDGKQTTLDLAVRQYVRSVIAAIEQHDETLICFPEEINVNNEQ